MNTLTAAHFAGTVGSVADPSNRRSTEPSIQPNGVGGYVATGLTMTFAFVLYWDRVEVFLAPGVPDRACWWLFANPIGRFSRDNLGDARLLVDTLTGIPGAHKRFPWVENSGAVVRPAEDLKEQHP